MTGAAGGAGTAERQQMLIKAQKVKLFIYYWSFDIELPLKCLP